jgi:hypothetical protein
LAAASVSWNLFDRVIRGMNLKRFTSSPHHRNNQLFLDSIIMVLIRSVEVVRRCRGDIMGVIKDLMELNHQT